MNFATLHDAIRAEAKPAMWSQGVKLARAGAVVEASRTSSEVVLRVKPAGRTVAFEVVLYPADAAWECNCPAHFDPCEHVCAAGIALHQAQTQGGEVKTVAQVYARVQYRFSRVDGGLTLRRVLVQANGDEAPMPSLKALLALPSEREKLQVEDHDVLMERLLERPFKDALNADRLDGMLTALVPCKTVFLEGVPVSVLEGSVFPRARIEDKGGAITVSLLRDERVLDVVSPGLALTAEGLCRLGATDVTGPWLERLPAIKEYQESQLGELTGRVLPELARRFDVEVKTKRVPRLDPKLTARIQLEMNHVEQGLSVLPTLVYGAPPTVRIDNGRLVHLRGPVPLRDEAAEARLVLRLREQLDLVPGRRATFAGPDMVRFADKVRTWRGDITGDGARSLSANLTLVPQLRVGGEGRAVEATLDFRVEGASGASTVSGEAVLRAWREGLGLVPIEGGGWAPLPAAWLDQHGARLTDLLAARAESGVIANHAVPKLIELCDALDTPKPMGVEKLRPLVDGFESLPSAPLPDDMTATLRAYQQDGVSWLHFLREAGLGGVLADDMGLGKTLQAICVLTKGSLIVCPTSVLPNWLAELKRFRPNLRVNAFHGPGRALDESADVTLTTYALLRLDEALLSTKPWKVVVLDEAQAIKNADSQTARAAFAMKGEFRLALSGTPIENRLEELWSVMHFANPGLLRGRREFQEQWAQPMTDGRTDVAQALRRRIKPFVLRRLKRDVAPELPPRTESVLHVQLDEKERSVYDTVYAATRADVMKQLNAGSSVMKVLEALLRLRQAACHSALVPGQQAKSSSKVSLLVDTLVTAAAEGHKALVFSQWTGLLDLIEPELKKHQLDFVRLDGTTSDRGAVTEKFQADDGPPVMLISLKAGGTGLNLTAADHVFLVDPWWNPAAEAQAADRAHRIGQTRPVNVYRLVSQGTVEEKILKLQDTKRALFEAALGDGGAAQGVTKEDLLELLE